MSECFLAIFKKTVKFLTIAMLMFWFFIGFDKKVCLIFKNKFLNVSSVNILYQKITALLIMTSVYQSLSVILAIICRCSQL